jgi:hypothetical protein
MTTPGNCDDFTTPFCDTNTDTLAKNQSDAITYCSGLAYGGFSDWFLPNTAQALKLYANKASIGAFASMYYWTREA